MKLILEFVKYQLSWDKYTQKHLSNNLPTLDSIKIKCELAIFFIYKWIFKRFSVKLFNFRSLACDSFKNDVLFVLDTSSLTRIAYFNNGFIDGSRGMPPKLDWGFYFSHFWSDVSLETQHETHFGIRKIST